MTEQKKEAKLITFHGFFDKAGWKSKITSANVTPKEMLGGYFLAPFCALLSNAVFSAYLNRYYVDVLNWTQYGAFSTLLPIVSVIFVILGNVLVGTWIDRTKTKQGKARPYIILALPLIVIAILLMFMTPQNASPAVQMVFIAITYNLYYSIAYPCYYTAHNSLVALSTRNSNSRGLLATLSNAAIVAAAGVGGSILVPILLQSYMFVSTANGLDTAASYDHWRILSVVFALLTAAGMIGEYFLTRERITEESADLGEAGKKTVSAKENLKACVKEPFWWMMILFILVFQFGQQFKNGSMNFFVRWVFDDVINSADPEQTAGTLTSALGLFGGLPTAIGMLVIWPIANKIGKKNALLFGSIISLAGGLVAFINVHSFGIVCLGVILKTIGIIPAQYVLLALLSDVLDHMEAKNGFRSDGITMAIYSAIYAGLPGLCNGILNGTLSATGYNNTGLSQNGATQTALIVMYLGIDMICFAICFFLILRMNVEKYSEEDYRTIMEHQKAAVIAQGGTFIDPKEKEKMEQEEQDRISEENRIRELKAACEKNGKNFEEENRKYLEKQEKRKNSFIGKLLG